MARQNTWGLLGGRPVLTSRGTGFNTTPITREGNPTGTPGIIPTQAPTQQVASNTPTTPSVAPTTPQGGSTGSTGGNLASSVPTTSSVANGVAPAIGETWLKQKLFPAQQTQQTLADGTTVGGYGDAGGSYYGGTDPNGNELFFGTPEEAAASLEQMDAINGTSMGQLTKQILSFANQHGYRPDPSKWNKNILGNDVNVVDKATNALIDGVSGVPFGAFSTVVNSTNIPANAEGNLLGQDFNVGGGGLVGLVGKAAYNNMNEIAEKVAAGEEGYHLFSGDNSITGDINTVEGNTIKGTPLAISPAPTGIGSVVSGNTQLAIQQNPALDINKDGELFANELLDYVEAKNAQESNNPNELAQANQKALDAIAEQEKIKANKLAAEKAQAAKEAALLAAIAQHDGGDSGHTGGYVGGTVVKDSSGNAVTSSSGNAVTSGGTWQSTSNNDSGGDSGGGGGGTVICTALMNTGHISKAERDETWKDTLKLLGKNTVRGYHKWAKPVARLVEKSKVAQKIWLPLYKAWKTDISYRLGKRAKTTLGGLFMRHTFERLSVILGGK